jgi:hypothetical protein
VIKQQALHQFLNPLIVLFSSVLLIQIKLGAGGFPIALRTRLGLRKSKIRLFRNSLYADAKRIFDFIIDNSDLTPSVNVGFSGASRRRNPLIENGAGSEIISTVVISNL